MTFKSLIRWIIGTYLLVTSFIVCLWLRSEWPVISTAERQEQVEVVKKRIEMGGEDNNDEYYFVSFKFSDGLEKEFQVGGKLAGKKIDDAIQIGDTGIVTYKERKDIDEKFANIDRWQSRRFLSFDKSSEYGGLKVERYGLTKTAGYIINLSILTLLTGGLIAILLMYRKKLAS